MQINIRELVDSGIIDEVTADKIQSYYHSKKEGSPKKIFVIFGILGAILIGLGIFLLVAHNWDNYSRATKSFVAFLPMLTGQLACAYTLWKKSDHVAWRESASVFLFFALGAGIALISQIYHIEGDESSFVLTWISLAFPLFYIMKASVTSVLFLAGNAYYGFLTGYESNPELSHYMFWVFLLAALPFYYHLLRTAKNSLFTYLHHWVYVFSVLINLGTIADDQGYWLIVAYLAFFGIILQVGKTRWLRELHVLANPFSFVGWAGSLILLYVVSFETLWSGELSKEWGSLAYYQNREFYLSAVLIAVLFIIMFFNGVRTNKNPVYWAAPLIFLLFVTQTNALVSAVTINFFILGMGLYLIVNSLYENHVARLNLGLSVICILIFCRFFDINIPFIIKGFAFLAIGTGFFIANYYLIKIRKQHEK